MFASCVKRLRFTQEDNWIRASMVRALTEAWGRPGELAKAGAELLKLDPEIGRSVAQAVGAWPGRLAERDWIGTSDSSAILTDPFLSALLESAPICDVELERFLTMARASLLEAVASGALTSHRDTAAALRFWCALARQCFINEYVFFCSDDEIRLAGELRDALLAALETRAQIPVMWPVAVAAYFPLCSLSLAGRLLEGAWPEQIEFVLAQQVREPSVEQQLRIGMPRLSGIDDEVSLRVQNQYEENPYPRWITAEHVGKARDLGAYLHQRFPLAPFCCHVKGGCIDVLIAGCGTGQHSISTAEKYNGARVLAVDLSLSSLAYAKRKTNERGLTSIEYAQADLMKLGVLERHFDLIESVGVLHHIADPWVGWRVLLSLLRPGGVMKIGLYSEVARRNIVSIRALVAAQGLGSTAGEIRQFRQVLMEAENRGEFGSTLNSPDFFSVSGCRDLLFHVQEHRMTLGSIAAFLGENHLSFLGFEIAPHVLGAYKQRFPDDFAATDLDTWQAFENENPDTFGGMYQFWIQKTGQLPPDSPDDRQVISARRMVPYHEERPAVHEINALVSLFDTARYAEASDLAQTMTVRFPRYGFAWMVLGVVSNMMGRSSDALAPMQRAVALLPDDAVAHNNLGNTLKDLGRLDEAELSYRQALRIKPDYAEAHSNLGSVLMRTHHLIEAETSYRRALEIKPDYAMAHSNLGVVLQYLGRLDEAEECYRMALQIAPDYAEAYNNLGDTLIDLGRLADAEACCRRAIEIRPDLAEAHNNLGNALRNSGRLVEAESSYRCALKIRPEYAMAQNNLGVTLQNSGRLDEAEVAFRRTLALMPDYAEAHNNLGVTLQELGQLDEAEARYRRALAIKPDYADAHNNLGNALKDQGRLDEAAGSYRCALANKPGFAEAYSNLLFVLNFFSSERGDEILAVCREYDERFCLPLRGEWQACKNSRDANRRLRVGYVSPDFRRHAVAYFAEPIFSNHDRSQVEIFCYAEVKREDEYTGRFRQLADHWRSTVGLRDDEAAEMIRSDEIDILVDLAGHTAGNRLLTFSRQPAPLQVTYLGYPGTSGLSAMNFRITDRHADPEGIADGRYTERLLRLPDSLCCYRPANDMPEVTALPALKSGNLTFGSFNNSNKIDDRTLALWATLLQRLPTARLILLAVPEGGIRQRLTRNFVELGIRSERLEFHGKLPADQFYRKFQEVDIALDPVSVSGGTTTCESLWMGVPVLTLVGECFITRVSYSFLETAGLSDFAAFSPEDYIRIATHLADNLPLLAEIRAGLREHLRLSPLVDEVGFTRNLEGTYRMIWKDWCSAI